MNDVFYMTGSYLQEDESYQCPRLCIMVHLNAQELQSYTHQINFQPPPNRTTKRLGWQSRWSPLLVEEISTNSKQVLQHVGDEKNLPEIEDWLTEEKSTGQESAGSWCTKLIHLHCRLENGGWLRDICPDDFCKLALLIGIAPKAIRYDFLEVFGLYCFKNGRELSFLLKLGRSSLAIWVYRPATRQTLALLCLPQAYMEDNHYLERFDGSEDWISWLQHPLGLYMDIKRRTLRSMSKSLGRAVRSGAVASCRHGLEMESGSHGYNTLSEEIIRLFYQNFDCCMLQSFCQLSEASKAGDLQLWMESLDTAQLTSHEKSYQSMQEFDKILEHCSRSRLAEFHLLKERIMVLQSVVRVFISSFACCIFPRGGMLRFHRYSIE